MAFLCKRISCGKRKFVKDVLTLLEIGAEGPLSEEELNRKVKESGLQGVHVYGAYGFFEKTKGTDPGVYRLNVAGLNLYMTHCSIQQAKLIGWCGVLIAVVAVGISVCALRC